MSFAVRLSLVLRLEVVGLVGLSVLPLPVLAEIRGSKAAMAVVLEWGALRKTSEFLCCRVGSGTKSLNGVVVFVSS